MAKAKEMQLVTRLLSLELLRQARQLVLFRSEFQPAVVLPRSLTSASQSQPGDRR
jgi:hypothetical protein